MEKMKTVKYGLALALPSVATAVPVLVDKLRNNLIVV